MFAVRDHCLALPKDGAALGGERPIGLLPIIVRILDRSFYGELFCLV